MERRAATPGDAWLDLLAMDEAINDGDQAEVLALGASIAVDDLPKDLLAYVSLLQAHASLSTCRMDDAARFARGAIASGELNAAQFLLDAVDEMMMAPDPEGRLARSPVWISGTGHFAGQCSTDSKSATVWNWQAEDTTGAPCLRREDASPRMR